MNLARDLLHVQLADAIRLTCLAATKDPEHFDGMAVRVVSRLVDERRLDLIDVLWACRRLQDCREGAVDGETGLLNLERQRPERRQV